MKTARRNVLALGTAILALLSLFGCGPRAKVLLEMRYSGSEAGKAATALIAGKNGVRLKDQVPCNLPQTLSFRPDSDKEYVIVFEVPSPAGGKAAVYGKMRVLATSPYTSSSIVKLTLDEATVQKVLDGEVQIITITDPNVVMGRLLDRPVELPILTLTLGNRAIELR